MREVIQCLIDWLESEPGDDKPYLVIKALAKESIKVADSDDFVRRFSGANLVDAIFIDSPDNKPINPSKWIDWSRSLYPYWDSRRHKIIAFARQQHLDSYPDLERKKGGGRSKETTYLIKSVPLPAIVDDESEASSDNTPNGLRKNVIKYELTPHGSVKPSWIAKWLLKNGQLRLTNFQRICFILGLGFIGLFPILMSYVSWLNFLIPRRITTQELALFPIILAFPYIVWVRFVAPCMKLFEDRIVLADELLFAFKEKSAQFELLKDGDLSFIRLVCYTAPCPICGSTIYLEKGEPDYPRRLVGRCYDSPREHVFSFDRVTQKGIVLRGEELLKHNAES